MDRREWLALAVSAGVAGFAGCSGDGGEQSPTTPDDTETPTETETQTKSDEAVAAEHIETVRTKLDEASSLIDEQSESDNQEFSADRVHAKLDDVESELDSASAVATDDQQTAIDRLRSFSNWLRSMADVFGAAKEGLNAFERANSYFQTERYDETAEYLDTAQSQFETADEHLSEARLNFEEIDESTLDEFESVSAHSAMDEMAAFVGTMIGFIDGYRDLTSGFDQFMTGAEAFDNQEWNESIDPLRSARDDFAAAESTFRDNEENAPQEIVESMIELTCLAGAMKDASTHYENAARAAQNGNTERYNDEVEQAEAATNRCS